MPTRFLRDQTPVVEFDARLEISPFTLFRRLAAGRDTPLLVDARAAAGSVLTLRDAIALPQADWSPPADRDVVLFDDDGKDAVEIARRLREQGHERVKALFGGLDLYAFALDPEVVGAETFLVRTGQGSAGS